MQNYGKLRTRIVTMPKDTNAKGNIFGGWIMSQIDIAGALTVRDLDSGNFATVAVNSLEFKKSVKVGDAVSCYGKIIKVGNSSVQTQIEVFAERVVNHKELHLHVTSALVTYVAVDEDGNKRPIQKDDVVLKELRL
ncbi:MAG: acyl-CoA thioesterase [Campylobacteraceae bacterium]|jgi:acyl-CoA thioesterase YciA|nr:acyl-CoA thioesterase [Campylobacteraceae bacterium]